MPCAAPHTAGLVWSLGDAVKGTACTLSIVTQRCHGICAGGRENFRSCSPVLISETLKALFLSAGVVALKSLTYFAGCTEAGAMEDAGGTCRADRQ